MSYLPYIELQWRIRYNIILTLYGTTQLQEVP